MISITTEQLDKPVRTLASPFATHNGASHLQTLGDQLRITTYKVT